MRSARHQQKQPQSGAHNSGQINNPPEDRLGAQKFQLRLMNQKIYTTAG
jgi:hypothetical protein